MCCIYADALRAFAKVFVQDIGTIVGTVTDSTVAAIVRWQRPRLIYGASVKLLPETIPVIACHDSPAALLHTRSL